MKKRRIQIGELCSIKSGFAFNSNFFNTDGKGIPLIRIRDVKSAVSGTFYEGEYKEEFLISDGDILIGMDGEFNREKWNGGLALLNQRVCKIQTLKSDLDQNYLYYLLPKLLKDIERETPFVTVKHLSAKKLAHTYVNLPPLEEQKRIAKILEKLNENISLANLRQIKAQALIQRIFSNTFTRSTLSNSDWPVHQLSEIVKKGTIITYGIVQAGDEYPGGIPYIRTGDISNNEISMDTLRHTSPEIASRFKRSTVYENEIVMSIRATVGTTALVPKILEGANLTQGTARIAPGENVTSEYLLNFLRSPKTQHWIKRQVKGATFREITLSRLRELPVVIPPISIQRDFSNKVKKCNELLDKISDFKNTLNEFYQSLESELINSAK